MNETTVTHSTGENMLCNRTRAVEYMREAKLDALIAVAPSTITYFSGYSWPLEKSMREYMFAPEASNELMFPGLVVFPAEGEPVLILGTLNNGLTLNDVSSFWQDVTKGVVLMLAVSLDQIRTRALGE